MNNEPNFNQSQSLSSSSAASLSYLNNNNNNINNTNVDFLYQLRQRQQNLTVVPIDKEAPSIENWYHGRLDRNTTAQRLKEANKPGAFLVRESERKDGSFVLSYLALNGTIDHFKITSAFGDYYIGGRQFDRLETLISYYMYYSELVEGEKLLEPIAPTRICKLERMYVSIKIFSKNRTKNDRLKQTTRSNTDKIEFDLIQNLDSNYWTNCDDDILYIEKIGELYRVFHDIGDGKWLWAQSNTTNEYGLLKADCVKYVEEDKLHEFEPWYYSNITKEEAVSILANAGNCSYLVRPSEQSPGDFTLFFNADNVVHRFRITGCVNRLPNLSLEKYFNIGGRDFSCITSIINRYMNEDITEGYRLTKEPHKRSDSYPQFTNIQEIIKDTTNYLKMSIDNNNYVEKEEKIRKFIDRENSIKKKFLNNQESIDLTSEAYKLRNSFTFDENHIVNSSSNTNNKNNENYINLNNLSMSLNEASLQSAISIAKNCSNTDKSNKLFGFRNHQTSNNTNKKSNDNLIKSEASIIEKNSLLNNNHQTMPTMSKSLSSPLSFQNGLNLKNNDNNSNHHFYDSTITTTTNSETFMKTSSSSSSSNKSNDPSQSNSSNGLNNSNNINTNQHHQNHCDSEILIQNKRTDKVILKGYLNKYNEKSKKWKLYWFSLNQTDHQLFYFSNEKKSKEKGLIDLSYGFYYPLDDSFFNRSYCFQIIIHSLGSNTNGNITNNNNSIVHYLCADNINSFKEWTENIRPLCNPKQYNPFVSKSFSSSSSSSLSISSSSSSSSPLNISLSQSEQQKLSNNSQKSSSIDQNYRILRTLNLDIHEARNVCFSPLFQNNNNKQLNLNDLNSNGNNNGQILNASLNSNLINHNSNLAMPKYHKDNLYYCLIIFNNDAIVASTRLTTCNNTNNNTSGSTCQSNSSTSFQQANINSTSGMSTSPIDSSSFQKQTCKDSIWDDSFSFDNLPLDVKELKICLFVIAKPSNLTASFVNNIRKLNNSNKMLDSLLIGYVNIRLDDLINKGLFESWYNIEPTVQLNDKETQSSEFINSNCSIRIKIRFCEEKIFLNKNYYKELSSFLLNENEHKNISILYEQIIPSTERPHFVQALLKFFIVKNKLIEMLKSFLLAEIDRCSDLSTLFRPATCSTSLMDQYMRVRCEDFLRKVVEEPLIRIFRHANSSYPINQNGSSSSSSISNSSNVKSFELDPTKCPDQVQREQNLFNFQVALKDLINSICNQNSVNLFPNELKHLFCLIRQHVHLKWLKQHTTGTDDKLVKIYCVSAFVFLRLLCPAMLNPKNFGLKFFTNLPNSLNHVHRPKNTQFNYYDLAQQFSVFSPSFMFTLCPTSSTTTHLLSQSSSTLSLFQQTSSSHQINCFNVTSLVSNSNAPNTSACSSSSNIQNTSIYERHIKLLAKVLQTLANMTECKEPFMLPLSDFLSSNKPNIIKFIEDISNLNEFDYSTSLFDFDEVAEDSQSIYKKNVFENEIKTQFENASCKYLAILNRLLNSLIPQMKLYIKKLEESIQKQEEEISESEILFSKSLKHLIDILNDINDNNNNSNNCNKMK